MRTFLLAALVFVVSCNCCRASEPADGAGGVAWGVVAGSPQFVGLMVETHQNQSMRLQGSVGTIILGSSLTGRVVFTRRTGAVRPYVFAGGGVLNIGEGDGGGGTGTSGFVWSGAGLTVSVRSVRLFIEAGIMGGLDRDKGYESPVGAAAVGVLFAP